LLLLVATGCSDLGASSQGADSREAFESAHREMVDQLLKSAVGLLNELDQYEPGSAVVQATARLNQWIETKKPLTDWQVDPLVATLPENLRSLPALQSLVPLKFRAEDGGDLQEAIWMRDVARAAVRRETDDLARARLLFDWTVRNIQLDAKSDEKSTLADVRLPWETLLFGHGQPIDRSWVFMLLARQQGLDVVLLAIEPEESKGEPRVWLPALMVDRELYLFDSELGLPIPKADGQGVATLAEAIADPKILDQLDLDAEHRYSVHAADLKRVTALVEASPAYLAQRMKLLELHLTGQQQMLLSADPSDLVERLKKCDSLADARLWTLPYERLARRAKLDSKGRELVRGALKPFRQPMPDWEVEPKWQPTSLWKARLLHLAGKYSDDHDRGAIQYYRRCRPTEADVAKALKEPGVAQQYPDLAANVKTAREDAGYWLGLIAFERGQYDAAIDYLNHRTLSQQPDGPWTDGARYNLARSYEAVGRTQEAADAYRAAQRHGDLLRARWLARGVGF
jgi:tetratricopeptide (TPR) repeat protein